MALLVLLLVVQLLIAVIALQYSRTLQQRYAVQRVLIEEDSRASRRRTA